MSSERRPRTSVASRAATSALSAALIFALFFLLPSQAHVLSLIVGIRLPDAIGSVLDGALQLWPLAVIVAAASSLFKGTKYEGISSTVWGFALFYILYSLLGGGAISAQSQENILGGAPATIGTYLWFSPLLWLTVIPIGAHVLRSCAYTYRAFAKATPASAGLEKSAEGEA